MTTHTQRIIVWSPRVLCILLALFLSVFALDVFGEGYSVGETMLALFMHLLPTFLLIITLIISWRREWVGAIVFNAFGLFLLISSGGESWFISVPLFVAGILFLVSWMMTRRLKTT